MHLNPTGSVSATANGHTYSPLSAAQSQVNGVDVVSFTCAIPASDLSAGTNLIGVSYGGNGSSQPANATTSVTLVGSSGSFTLSAPNQPLVVEASHQGSTSVAVTPTNGFTGLINMACTVSAATTGHSPTCAAASATVYGSFGATSVMSIVTYADTSVGNYTVIITGTGGQESQSVQLSLQITPGPGFALSATTSSLTTSAAGQTATDVVTISPTRRFLGSVALHCTIATVPALGKAAKCILPDYVAFGSSTPLTATLGVDTDSTTPAGTYTVLVSATAGLVQQSLALPFTLPTVAATPAFQLSAASTAVSIAAAGESATDTLTSHPANGLRAWFS